MGEITCLFFYLAVFGVVYVVSRTVSQFAVVVVVVVFYLWLDDFYVELVQKSFECEISPELTLCGWQDVETQELTFVVLFLQITDWFQCDFDLASLPWH